MNEREQRFEIAVRNGLVVYPEKTIRADIGISAGKISAVGPPGSVRGDIEIDASGKYVLPGIIDPHVHPVYQDKIEHASKSGLFGGVTTLVHYAYAKPGDSLVGKIEAFIEEGRSDSYTDFALHGGLFETMKQADEIPAAFKMGVTSFKVFMSYAKLGWMTDDYAMCKAMDIAGRLGGMVAVHSETGLAIDYIQDKLLSEKADFAERFLETSPDLAEAEGIFRAVSIGRMMNCPVYIPHVSSAAGIRTVSHLKQNGYTVFAETCPQYLGLTWDRLKARGPLGKVGPSIKSENDRSALWKGIYEGIVDTIGSDHAAKDKRETDDFFDAPYGSPEIETMLPVLWEYGVNRGIVTPNRLAAIMSENAAKIMGLFPKKGRLDTGSDADIVVFDPSEVWTVSSENQHTNAAYTLFEGEEMTGKVDSVIAGGVLKLNRGELLQRPGGGRFLPTKAASQDTL